MGANRPDAERADAGLEARLPERHRGGVFPNNDQRAVIEAVRESLLVLSPMGTGKTRTAAAAVARAIGAGIAPERILGLTFTNRAAEAMRRAVAEALPEDGLRVALFNLHGLCARLLREECAFAGLPPDFGILDEDESAELLWQFVSREDRAAKYDDDRRVARSAYEKFVFRFLTGEEKGPVPDEFRMYRDAMRRDGTVDFTGLIARAWHALRADPTARARWSSRFEWILVDEVQDINLAEYRIIALLGEGGRCVKMFGDTHQTIFEWRFAQPRQVIEAFDKEFAPRRLALKTNYRCAPALVEASNALRRAHIRSREPFPTPGLPEAGGEIAIRTFDDSEEETRALVTKVAEWREAGLPLREIAVLARANRTLAEISAALRTARIPHLVFDEFDFFRRQEVKDVAAVLEHLVAPFRRTPVLRLLKAYGASEGALARLERDLAGTGLHMSELVRGAPGDPLHPLLEAWSAGRVVVVDTETTGLDPADAEVVQLARADTRGATSAFLRPTGTVGESVRTHGFTDAFLREKGCDARETFAKMLRFERGAVLVGHNVAFDMRMLARHATHVGAAPVFPPFFDTMPLAAACLEAGALKGLRLEAVASALGVELPRAHDAEADARATFEVLDRLMPRLVEKQPERLRVLGQLSADLALALRKTTVLFKEAREAEAEGGSLRGLILAIWERFKANPGVRDYRINPARESHVRDLAAIAEFLAERRGGRLSLPAFLEQVALSRRDMLLEADPERVRLLTAHAAKGLEFEAVAIPRLIKPYPDYSDEEARVFYVMLTRARTRLWLSWPKRVVNPWGRELGVERLKYLAAIEPFAQRA
ncbi:MAG: UvrD-helicase domain-containing protein [Verrucomicrobiae bacterium]|nr:UvrD-helicase domain-containing protein [Verrucomicrobiae bacterium]